MKPYLRNFVRGLIDGILTAFGIVVGASISNSNTVIIITALSGGIADCFGNLASAVTAESADVYTEINELEKKMMIDKKEIKNMMFFKKKISETYLRSIVDAISTIVGVIIPITPFLFINNINLALQMTILISVTSLFILGMLIGKISKENMLKLGIKTCFFGVAAAFVCFLLTKFLGASK
ncbi:MAG: VIT1/CCC1 transporter family protein [Candidatus Parvarchaeota archaeon]|nr:VIT1/CCC1 transporter family protein [Candidatus Jingweiarchaeum tengchongense]MCW1297859.1 VIT1/CCC1 transporter family protein [Candidatus Jingweiarchaeum tengchongense]MCW1299870.1 VIT1/CCC1 transporter family protein [Candidatus Jingweiarchaeum tengchongense]MCW1304160.1 VIT1/CCC1 transporter family protein [Candidatus Jingweiarchaeum tengchongense]MCW1305188.1 VIT1/CCC1 transporter family protein [Candidatus Jingweiarchaeum tengchongense]